MLRTGWIGLAALLFHTSTSAGVLERNCHLLEHQVYALLAQNDHKDGNPNRDGGVGGTGIVAEITGTSPLSLAGCKVEVTASTSILDEQNPMGADKLARGQIVYAMLNASDGRFQASSIVVQHALEGVVAKTGANNTLEILGKPVLLVPGQTQMPSLPIPSLLGANVKVSGFRLPDGTVIASRIDTYEHLDATGTTGLLERNGTGYTVGGIEVTGLPDSEWIGDTVSVLGNWSGNKIEATQFELAGWRKGESTPRWVFLEGRLRQGELGRIGLVDGPSFSGQASQLLEGLRLSNGDPVSVFGRRLPDGSIQVHQLWKN